MATVGICMGHQSSLVAAPNAGGIEVLLNEYSQRKTATMVCFGEKQRELGESARAKAVTKYQNTVCEFEPFLGRRFADADVQQELKSVGYTTVAMEDGSVGVVVTHLGEKRTLSITQIAGMILAKIKTVAEAALKTKVADCVVGVPVFFNDEQRHALLAACKIANINCLRLLNETSAVALGWGIYQRDLPVGGEGEKPRRVVFVDLGNASLQMSACEFVKGKVTILATAHDALLGGRDFDVLLADHFTAEFKAKYKIDVNTNVRARMKLLIECEKLKQSMSANSTELPLNIECLMDDKDVTGRMCRETFEGLAAPLLARLEATAERLLAAVAVQSEGKLAAADFDTIEIVGGTVRIPAVKTTLHKVFGREISTTLNLDEIVAKGCALYAAIVSPAFRVREFELVDKTPYAITLHWTEKDGKAASAEVFKAHGAAKLTKVLTFQRDADFTLEAKYGSPADVLGSPALIGSYRVAGVKPSFDGQPQRVKVHVRLDEHGCFRITEASMADKLPVAAGDEAAAAAAAAAGEDDDDEAEKKAEPVKKAPSKPGEKKEEAPAPKKVKTTKLVPLTVTEHKPFVLSDAQINGLLETENEFAAQDHHEAEKSNAKNALEEYIYYIRDKLLENDEAKVFIREDDAAAFAAKLSALEDWLYDEGDDTERQAYAERLAGLKALGDPALARAKEAEARPAAEEAFRKALVFGRKFVDLHAAGDELYSHIDGLEAAKVKLELDAADKWLADALAAQAKLPAYENPVTTAAKLDAQREVVTRAIKPIIGKPKPVVVPPPPPAPEAAPAAPEAADAAAAPAADAAAAPAADEGEAMKVD